MMASLLVKFPCRVSGGFCDPQCTRNVPIASSPYLDRSGFHKSAFGALLGSKMLIADMTLFEKEKCENVLLKVCNKWLCYLFLKGCDVC